MEKKKNIKINKQINKKSKQKGQTPLLLPFAPVFPAPLVSLISSPSTQLTPPSLRFPSPTYQHRLNCFIIKSQPSIFTLNRSYWNSLIPYKNLTAQMFGQTQGRFGRTWFMFRRTQWEVWSDPKSSKIGRFFSKTWVRLNTITGSTEPNCSVLLCFWLPFLRFWCCNWSTEMGAGGATWVVGVRDG